MRKFSVLVYTVLTLLACNNKAGKNLESKKTGGADSAGIVSSHVLHEMAFGHHQSLSEDYWDSLNKTVLSPPDLRNSIRNKNYKTFGWHLYSRGSAYKAYRFSLLWGVSYFAYILNPENGSYKNIHQWKTSGLIDSAKVWGSNVFLTLANFGESNNSLFLNNAKAQGTTIDSVKQLLLLRNADGINIDFENVHAENKEQFMTFIKTISQELKSVNPGSQVSVCLYAVDYQKIFDINKIDSFVDFYTLMGYDYYGSFSPYAGPVAPLVSSKRFGKNSLESSVDYYVSLGVKPEKLILGLPHYGADWIVGDTTLIAKAEKFHSHKSYKTIKNEILNEETIAIHFDSTATSNYCNFLMDGKQIQLWFDGVESLSYKYDWIKQQNLAGVGIWALGFDNGSKDLWDLLSEKFAVNEARGDEVAERNQD